MPFRKSGRTAIPPRGKPSAGHGHETPRAPGVSHRPDHGSAPRLRNSPLCGSIPRKRSTAVFGLPKSPTLRELAYRHFGIAETNHKPIRLDALALCRTPRGGSGEGQRRQSDGDGDEIRCRASPYAEERLGAAGSALPRERASIRGERPPLSTASDRCESAASPIRWERSSVSEPSSPYVAPHARERPLLLARPSGKVSRRSPCARKGPPPEPSFRPFTAKPPSMEYGYAPLSRYASMTARKASP